MKHIITKLSLSLFCFCLVACDTNFISNTTAEPSLDQQKADVLTQFEQCHQLQAPRISQQKKLIEECRNPLISKLADIENELYRKAHGLNYSQLEPYEKGYWYGVKNNHIGILDNQGQVVVEPKYKDMGILHTGPNYSSYLYYSENALPDPVRHYLNISSKPEVNYFYPVVYFLDVQANWGAINIETKEVVVPFKYQEAGYVGKGYVELIERDLKTDEVISRVVVNQRGEIVLDAELYDQYSLLDEGYIQVQKDQKYGIVKNNREIIPVISENEFSLDGGLLIAGRWKSEERQFYSLDGKLIVLPKGYQVVDGLSKDSQVMSVINDKNKQYSIWTKSGKKLFDHLLKVKFIEDQYIQISKGKNLSSFENYESALIDLNGNIVLDYKYTEFDAIKTQNHSTLIETRLIDNFGMLNSDLKELIPAKFQSISYNSYDEINVTTFDNLHGIYSVAGKVIFEPIYKDLYDDYFAPIMIATKGEKIALFSLTGKPITDFTYESNKIKMLNNDKLKEFFPNGAIIAKQDGMVGIIDYAGQAVLPFEYQDLDFVEQYQVFRFKQKDKWGIIAPTGEVIIAAQYDDLEMHNTNQYLVRIDKKSGMINLKGESIIPIDYDQVYSLNNGDYFGESEKEESRFFSVKKNELWGVWDVVENKQIISSTFPSESFRIEQNDFTNIYHDRNIIVNRDGHDSVIYAQRQHDNQEQYGIVPTEPIAISENILASGKKDYKKLVNYFYQVESTNLQKSAQLKNKLTEFYLGDDTSPLIVLFDDYIHHLKRMKNEIEDLKITDPEVKYLADQFLAYNFMRVQYQEEYKKFVIEASNSDENLEKRLISLEKNYKSPTDTAEWEMNKTYILLKQKYNKFYQGYMGELYTYYHYDGQNHMQFYTTWLFEDIRSMWY